MLLAASAVGLAACGSHGSTHESDAASSEAPLKAQTGQQVYADAQGLAEDITKYGHACVVAPSTAADDYAASTGQCETDIGTLQLKTYPNAGVLAEQLSYVNKMGAYTPGKIFWVSGSTWAVVCPTGAACESIQSGLGGIITAP